MGIVLVSIYLITGASLTAATRTLTGIVSDAKCGTAHSRADARACTRDCVRKGSDYALVINGAVYTLNADAVTKAKLRRRAGKTAVVVGDVTDMIVIVMSVTTPKKIKKH